MFGGAWASACVIQGTLTALPSALVELRGCRTLLRSSADTQRDGKEPYPTLLLPSRNVRLGSAGGG